MADDRLDLVVFGASGYTGKHVVRELARMGPQFPALRWAVAGRSTHRLQTLLRGVQQRTGIDLSATRTIVADVSDESSLRAMCGQAKLVLNCCGPFTKLGEPVVAAAVACGAHYVDVNGEKLFVEVCEQKFGQRAREAGLCVVTACGLSSVPADLGVIHLQQTFGGTLNSVESYLVITFSPKFLAKMRKGVLMYSTWESMITSMAAMPLKSLEQKPFSPQFEPELKQRCLIHKNMNRWCLPFPGTDMEVVNKTQRHILASDQKRPAQYKAYITFTSIFTVMGVVFIGALLFLLSKVSCLRKLLLNYPRLCSFGVVTYDHPGEGVMDDMCLQYEMYGEGWEKGSDVENTPPNRKVVGRVGVSGPDAPYVGTAVVVIYSALTVLQERDKMPKRGGVMTPGVAFRNTSLVKNLHENNVKFEIVTNQ